MWYLARHVKIDFRWVGRGIKVEYIAEMWTVRPAKVDHETLKNIVDREEMLIWVVDRGVEKIDCPNHVRTTLSVPVAGVTAIDL